MLSLASSSRDNLLNTILESCLDIPENLWHYKHNPGIAYYKTLDLGDNAAMDLPGVAILADMLGLNLTTVAKVRRYAPRAIMAQHFDAGPVGSLTSVSLYVPGSESAVEDSTDCARLILDDCARLILDDFTQERRPSQFLKLTAGMIYQLHGKKLTEWTHGIANGSRVRYAGVFTETLSDLKIQ